MEMFKAHSHNSTELSDRILWIDGDSTVEPSFIIDNITKGNKVNNLYVAKITDDIEQYNNFVSNAEKIKVKEELLPLDFDWNIPDEYKSINVVEYVADKLEEHLLESDANSAKQKRIAMELKLFYKMGLFDTIKALIYIVNTLIEKEIVWGVGRGSSVASYVLYVIGVHDVDSFHYDLDITEFLRTK